ncbi:Fungalysin metallopeptidase-domain-containing protein [Crucibulum laeve]|uniref:Extracellular metalloproteinase n=1 Tax=Crucibulum laeve TaxID=68775 RepID=A0A5C3LQH2_9AGAR|nr:Fungalysin metallopeptidase-domain-containing protein [Crucibulum laeve]
MSPRRTAIEFVRSRLGVDSKSVGYKSGFASGSEKFAYVKQYANNLPFVNAVANVSWKDDKVVAFGSSFVKSKKIASANPTVEVSSFLSKIEASLGGKYNNHPTTLEYLARPDGTAALVHVVQIQNEEFNTWFEAYVDAHTGELLSVTDFTSNASYRVLPITKKIITEGLETLTNPQDLTSSPYGWHSVGTTNYTTTEGNNVVAYKTSSSTGLDFNYVYDPTQAPTTTANLNAARVNAFYTINVVHDFAYRYGFTEAAFNFQNNNFGKGGSANYRVKISVQDTSGTNNANFATPPDGQSGTCRMYIWTYTTPNRDGSLENDIVVHEMTHGIINRLTGGGTGRCLQTTEAGGLGEGWSDALADLSNSFFTGTHFLTYRTGIGEVWANILHNVYAALVSQYGWSATARTNPSGTEGNIVYLHLFLDALALQPCNPTFVTARAAWIQADQNRYGDANKCLLWKAFASRGLGANAVSASYVNNFAVPTGC